VNSELLRYSEFYQMKLVLCKSDIKVNVLQNKLLLVTGRCSLILQYVAIRGQIFKQGFVS